MQVSEILSSRVNFGVSSSRLVSGIKILVNTLLPTTYGVLTLGVLVPDQFRFRTMWLNH